MPRPTYSKTVIARAIERYYEVPKEIIPEALADKIIEALDIAEDIMGLAPEKPNVLIQTLKISKPLDLSKALLIGQPGANQVNAEIVQEEAPPAAVVRNPDGVVQAETEEEIETKKAQLHAWILANLPRSLTLKLPGFEKDVQLNLYVRPAPVKMNFIRIFYTQFAEEEDGPQLQLSTSDANLDAAQVKAAIVAQAESRYRATKQKIEARIPPPNPMPDLEQAFRNAKYDPESDKISEADRQQWNSVAGKVVI